MAERGKLSADMIRVIASSFCASYNGPDSWLSRTISSSLMPQVENKKLVIRLKDK